jgi:hypothetical protein
LNRRIDLVVDFVDVVEVVRVKGKASIQVNGRIEIGIGERISQVKTVKGRQSRDLGGAGAKVKAQSSASGVVVGSVGGTIMKRVAMEVIAQEKIRVIAGFLIFGLQCRCRISN